MTRAPLVYIVVLNYNNYDDTVETIESIERLDYENYKILLVDNGSEKEVVERIRERFPELRIVETGKNLGYAGGNNFGIRVALSEGAEYVLVLNNDIVLESDALKKMVEIMEKEANCAACQPLVKFYKEREKIWSAGTKMFLGYPRLYLKGKKEAIEDVFEAPFGLSGCAILVRASAFRDIGLFDERLFLMHEETEWCVRAKKKGYKLLVVASAVVYHKVSATLGFLSEKYLYYVSRNWLIVARSLGLKGYIFAVVTEFLVRLPYYLVLLLMRKRIRPLGSYLRGVLHGLCGRAS